MLVDPESNAAEADFAAFRDRVFSASEDTIEWVTAPLVHFHEGKCVEHRTGILIQIADMRFLVTAAHGLIAHNEKGRSLHIAMPDKDLATVPLIREKFWSTKDPREDIAVTQLHESTVDELGEHYRYTRLTNMMSKNHPFQSRGLYFLMGFPFAMIRLDESGFKKADTWKYLTSWYHGDLGDVTDYDPSLHVILDYERKSSSREGEKVHPPGLSGCGIWFVGHPGTHALFKKDDFRLVGIQTAWHKYHEYAKGTWIDDVLLIFWKYYPDTRKPMQLLGIRF